MIELSSVGFAIMMSVGALTLMSRPCEELLGAFTSRKFLHMLGPVSMFIFIDDPPYSLVDRVQCVIIAVVIMVLYNHPQRHPSGWHFKHDFGIFIYGVVIMGIYIGQIPYTLFCPLFFGDALAALIGHGFQRTISARVANDDVNFKKLAHRCHKEGCHSDEDQMKLVKEYNSMVPIWMRIFSFKMNDKGTIIGSLTLFTVCMIWSSVYFPYITIFQRFALSANFTYLEEAGGEFDNFILSAPCFSYYYLFYCLEDFRFNIYTVSLCWMSLVMVSRFVYKNIIKCMTNKNSTDKNRIEGSTSDETRRKTNGISPPQHT
eukprot:GHVH01001555.1.p1 GENE.GHVH01001555.1~~GHVH01001555.1.p1  ORF type:complete len:317 (+),score=26.83 GHVH01001555.1:31-981(+)